MEKPYRIRKKLIMTGHSFYCHIPAFWIAEQGRRLKSKWKKVVILEISDNKIVITPENQKMDEEEYNEIKDMLLKLENDLKHVLEVTDARFNALKKVIGDYLELSSNLSIASVKANLKNV